MPTNSNSGKYGIDEFLRVYDNHYKSPPIHIRILPGMTVTLYEVSYIVNTIRPLEGHVGITEHCR